MRSASLAILVLAAVTACGRQSPTPPSPQVTVYFCKAGTDTLVPMPFSVDPHLSNSRLESLLVGQLLAGPPDAGTAVVMFPAGTRASVTVSGNAATVDFSGTLADHFHGGASDEIALFKSLTYTVTSVAGVKSVQVLVNSQKRATLNGGEFAIDEPLSRETFSQ